MNPATLGVEQFREFFQAVHGYPPFEWQAGLAEHVLTGGEWYRGIDVPTGLGKTAVVDVAVFALAAQADRPPAERTAPTRLFVAVDRRVIVDQTFDRANVIAAALVAEDPEPVVAAVAAALRSIAGGPRPLEVVRMRGGTTWSWRWLAEPAQPAVVVATVDQFGSRLLFRGYGVGPHLRPIDAALCGTDALVVLDEAHLSQSFIDTATAVAVSEARAEHPVLAGRARPPVLLSATLPAGMEAFRPDLSREVSDRAGRRLGATRTAHLLDLSTPKQAEPELAEAMAALARLGLARPGIERVAVVCNTVRLARRVFERLEASPGSGDIALLIGRCREVERRAVTGEWSRRLQAAEERTPAAPVIAVATQTIEVGADFDFDFMVTEAAPLDALLQRLGRLNRLGRQTAADAVILHATARHGDDPVYGLATDRTWEWLAGQGRRPEPVRGKDAAAAFERAPSVELGPGVASSLSPESRRQLAADAPLSPVVLGPMLDAWARTSPSPVPDQPVAPYLHGVGRPVADVLVCWRAGLPEPSEGGWFEAWEEELRTAPVQSGETVAVPIWDAVRFLEGAGDTGGLSDLEGVADDDDDIDLDERRRIAAVVASPDGAVAQYDPRRLRPGDTVVLPSEAGGHDRWGWTGAPGRPVPDVADRVLRRRDRVRLRSEVLVPDPLSPARHTVEQLIGGLRPEPGEDGRQADGDRVRRALHGLASVLAPEYSEVADQLTRLAEGVLQLGFPNERWVVATGPRRFLDYSQPRHAPPPDDETGDAGEWASSASGRTVSLEQHLGDVGRGAERQARLLGFPEALVAAVELAGRSHDLGKADDRFQAMLRGGDALAVIAAAEPLAKSGMDAGDSASFRQARVRSGWPAGMRHEAISGALVAEMTRSSPELFVGVDLELVHHLVQSHHGRARPLLPALADDSPRPVTAGLPGTDVRAQVPSDRDLVDWEGPARFDKLCRRYGRWGLALLEAVVRLADMAASQSYERKEPA